MAFLLMLAPGMTRPARAAERVELEVVEPAGLARGGYPAHGVLRLPRAVAATTRFRLLRDGKPVPVQFRPDGAGPTSRWWLDFQTAMAPREVRPYVVEYGPGVTAGPEPVRGHRLIESGDAFRVVNAPYITWTIPRDLKGFLRSVHFPPAEFLRPDSPGLLVRDRRGRVQPFAGRARVVRQGSLAVGLRFEQAAGPEGVRSVADLTFPSPVSWVELEWTVEDPRDRVAALGLELHLGLDAPIPTEPTLVDFGAAGTVYAALHVGQEADLMAGTGRPWQVRRGGRGRLMPVAVGVGEGGAGRAEGWAHVMDRKRCLALAVGGFGRDAADRLGVTADGRVQLWREFGRAATPARKRLRCWLHFVFFPPQASAGASPQQMQAPLVVRMKPR